MRRCIGCGNSYPQRELIRIAYYDDQLRVDENGRSKGRGVYLCKKKECLAKSLKGGFARAYKKNFDREVLEKLLDEVREKYQIED